jgi:hypothetical protein
MYTECNRIRYITLKIYCDQTNRNITTQFVTEHLLTLQVLHHMKPSTRGHHYVALCSHTSKWRTLLTWKRRSGFIRIMVKKHLRENPFASGTSRLLGAAVAQAV